MSNGLKTKLAQKNGDLAGSGVSRLKEEIEKLKSELAKNGSHDPKTIRTTDIKTNELLESLFPIRDSTLIRIKESISDEGYDVSQPIVVLMKSNLLIDGHTRLKACKDLGLDSIPVHYVDLPESQIMLKALSYQTNRRNLTDGDLFGVVQMLLENRRQDALAGKGQTKDKLAALLGMSSAKAQRCMTVVDKGSTELHAKVQANEVSINKAYQQVMKAESRKVHDVIFKELSGPGNTIVNVSPTVKLTLEGNIIYHDKTPLVTLHSEALSERSVPDKFSAQLIHMLQSYLNQTK